jgi:subfamily B ATP-binding cassette protein HlyB/CyaB
LQDANGDSRPDNDRPKDSGLLALVTILRFFNLPADAEQIRHQFGKPGAFFAIEDLQLAAKRLKLKSRIVQSGWERLAKTNLPAIAEIKNGSFVIVAKIDAEQGKVLVQNPIAGRAVAVDKADFEEKWSGRLLLATRRAAILGQGGKFDISWFVAALSKYRRIFIEVLIASFFLQLFALISPLFFQVVIDKVLVHRGLTTLDVLVFGLLVVSVFEVLLGTLRTYIFSHTTNRVDVELGARLFRHLLSLPMGYFQARQVGQSVARVRELESIRNFITGSALTLVIDLFFTIVFFAVMWHFSPLLTMIVLGSVGRKIRRFWLKVLPVLKH